MRITSVKREILSDRVTPVELFLKFRDKYPEALLLESGDYHGERFSLSYLCLDPIAGFVVNDDSVVTELPGKREEIKLKSGTKELQEMLHSFLLSLKPEDNDSIPYNGIFGYTNFEAAARFDKTNIDPEADDELNLPLMRYHFYRYLVIINHHNNRMIVIENIPEGESSGIESILSQLQNHSITGFPFECTGDESGCISDDEYVNMVRKGKYHCKRGDVFQIVLSRRFKQRFKGDEFNVYRALRYINPSPWMFFFDYGEYRIFGSSPESQIIIDNGIASINPIAGTYRRTGDDKDDLRLAEKLLDDPKELAEHVMLVDLARNDLSRHSRNVTVKTFKEIQFYSHVLHMVSSVAGEIPPDTTAEMIFADTFPAGTLSGAPKIKALELISKYEPHKRSFYGGAIGKIGFGNQLHHAITIRSLLSKNNVLYYQAGAGIVDKSDENAELQEVNNKLGALRSAISMAKNL